MKAVRKQQYTFFFYKQRVYKHTQPQIREILSTLLSTPPASDFEIDNKISEKLLFFPKISEKNAIFSKISEQYPKHFNFFSFSYIHSLIFLDASSHLYMRVCPSVRWSVRGSVCPLALRKKRRNWPKSSWNESYSRYI